MLNIHYVTFLEHVELNFKHIYNQLHIYIYIYIYTCIDTHIKLRTHIMYHMMDIFYHFFGILKLL